MSANVLVETRDRVTRIELARIDKKNALTPEMYGAIAGAMSAAESDPQVRAMLIHGKPDCFCAGNDLNDFLERPPHGERSSTFDFLHLIATLRKPLVAAVGGVAVGIGTTMLLHCELVYAAPNARFQLPFVPLGLVPEAGSSLLLPAIAGYQRAAELLLLGRPFGADKALAAGFVTEIVAEADLLEIARNASLALAALPPASVRLTKQLMKAAFARAVGEQIETEGRAFRERLGSPEAKEAMTAFFEKRKPDFSRFS
ncbi:MAG TPA: enoyl-CoA hydratase [Burkholderiales bacterium]|nr:enoyl-CoA hydratase [Burkholderiales bacterium]